MSQAYPIFLSSYNGRRLDRQKLEEGKVEETNNTGRAINKGVAPLGNTQVFPISSFWFSLGHKIGFHQCISLLDPSDAADRRPFPVRPPMVNPVPAWKHWLVAEDLGTRAILSKLSTILTIRFRTISEDGADLPSDKRLGQGIHSFLAQLALVVDNIPGLDRVTLVVVDPDGMVNLLHSLFSIPVDLYSSIWCLFACQGELPAEGLPLVVEITHESFAALLSVSSVPQVDHGTYLRVISPTNFQKMSCEREGKRLGRST